MTVVSDTSPLNYLIVTGLDHILPTLFGRIAVPAAVYGELSAPGAPEQVKVWLAAPPGWLEVRVALVADPGLAQLGPGEREAIALAETLGGGLVLLDETKARRTAIQRGLRVVGTLGLLDRAAARRPAPKKKCSPRALASGMVRNISKARPAAGATNHRNRPGGFERSGAGFADAFLPDLRGGAGAVASGGSARSRRLCQRWLPWRISTACLRFGLVADCKHGVGYEAKAQTCAKERAPIRYGPSAATTRASGGCWSSEVYRFLSSHSIPQAMCAGSSIV